MASARGDAAWTTAVDAIALARTDVRELCLVAHRDQVIRAVQSALRVSTPLRVLQGLRELYRGDRG